MTDYTPEQIESNRRIWLAALRSGAFKQVGGKLAEKLPDGSYGYCCLGVACEISGVVRAEEVVRYDSSTRKAYAGSDLTLPPEVQAWLGVSSDSPALATRVLVHEADEDHEEEWEDMLTGLNDNHGLDFEAIADLIEKNGLR